MRALIGVVVVLVTLWSGYWFVGSRGVEAGLAAWIDARRAEGWVAEYSDISTIGYPNRFDTTISDLALADPATGLAWNMPFFQILTLSYTPNHIIAVFPGNQTLASPHERLTITSEVMRGSVIFVPDTTLQLQRSSFELEDVRISSSKNWTTRIEAGQLATRQADGNTDVHDIFFEATGWMPSDALLGFLDPGNLLPETLGGTTIDLSVTFDAPWDRFALERRRPQPTALELKTLRAEWGELLLEGAGTLEVDRAGWPTGTIDLRAKNWRGMLRIARQTGAIPATIAPTVETALEVLASMSGNPETLDAPLTFRSRRMFFGGFPIGPAPNLSIR